VCCIIEQNLELDGDFEGYYKQIIATFYQNDLAEIEKETIQLLTFKNYYAMKNTLIRSGVFAVVLLVLGIVFKFMHWPGAAVLLVVSIATISQLFLPLVFILKSKESTGQLTKWILGIAILSGMAICMGTLFKAMHWPFANRLLIGAIGGMGLLFLPLYFFTGIKKTDTKINTILNTIFILVGCGLFLTLVRSPQASAKEALSFTALYYGYEQQLAHVEKTKLADTVSVEGIQNSLNRLEKLSWYQKANQVKEILLKANIGKPKIPADFKSQQLLIEDNWVYELTKKDVAIVNTFLSELRRSKSSFPKSNQQLIEDGIFFQGKDCRLREALLSINQLQLSLLLN